MQVIWKRLYNISSKGDQGTLYQLRNLINRRNVVRDPSKRFTPCEDFWLLIVEAHIVTACMHVFSMTSLDDTPANTLFPPESYQLPPKQRRSVFLSAIMAVVKQFVNITYSESDGCVTHTPKRDVDHVQEYAREVLGLGLLFMEFADATREGDGGRILRCYRFFLPLFKASKRKNYSIDALNLLLQHDYVFSPRLREQLLWSRTVNMHGKPGRNIPCDLEMEHLNRICKTAMGHTGANLSDSTVCRVGKSVGETRKVLHQFDEVNSVPVDSGKHSTRSSFIDLEKVLQQLQEINVFESKPGRKHAKFRKIRCNMTSTINKKKFVAWMNKHLNKLYNK